MSPACFFKTTAISSLSYLMTLCSTFATDEMVFTPRGSKKSFSFIHRTPEESMNKNNHRVLRQSCSDRKLEIVEETVSDLSSPTTTQTTKVKKDKIILISRLNLDSLTKTTKISFADSEEPSEHKKTFIKNLSPRYLLSQVQHNKIKRESNAIATEIIPPSEWETATPLASFSCKKTKKKLFNNKGIP